jgi:hypothetical protein
VRRVSSGRLKTNITTGVFNEFLLRSVGELPRNQRESRC